MKTKRVGYVGRWIVAMGGCALASGVYLAACGDETTPAPTGNCAPGPECQAVDHECLALVDNSGESEFTLRMAQLSVTTPESLAIEVMYNVIANGVNINMPDCGVHGQGTFCWLLQFNTTTGMARIGGALPQRNPFDGYCFLDPSTGFGPVDIAALVGADGSFNAGPIPYIRVPIFLVMDDPDNYVVLPLHQVMLINGKLSADQNCIGRFNADGLQPFNNCLPDVTGGIEYFINSARLEGFIELEEADTVIVDSIKQTLCVVLSGNPSRYGDDQTPKHCTRDGADQIEFKGDWCSATDSAGGCQDAVRVTAEFAGSAVELRTDCPSGMGGGGGAAAAGGAGGSTGGAAGAGGSTGGAGGS